MDYSTWIQRTTRGDSMRRIAEVADVSDRTLSRQLREKDLRPDLIIKIAEAYNESPVIALVDLGFMSAKWITEPGVVTALSRASDEELTDELLRRLQLLSDEPADDLARKRSKSKNDVQDTDYGDSMPLDAVAYDGPDEDKLREERGE